MEPGNDQVNDDKGVAFDLKRAMKLATKACPLSRAQIVDKLNEMASLEGLKTRGKEGLLTIAMLDKWLAPEARESVIPVKWLTFFCQVTGSLGPLAALAAPLGARVIDQADQVLLEMARAQVAKKQAARKERRLADQYEEMAK